MTNTPPDEADEAERAPVGARAKAGRDAAGVDHGAAPSAPSPSARACVAAKWRAVDVGAHYAEGRFRGARRRDRDGRLVARLLRRLGDERVGLGRVLDAPTGTGRLVPQLAARATRVVGLDVSRAMLTATDEAWQVGVRADDTAAHTATRTIAPARVEGSVFQLPFVSRAFDLVVSCRLLHHLVSPEDRRAALVELARVARGHVVMSYWDATSWHAWRRRTRGPLRRVGHDTRVAVTARELDADLAAVGLAPVARAHSLRFVSPQTWVLAAVR